MANPITTPSIDRAKCTTKSCNVQFRYETEQELEYQLRREYGNVKSILKISYILSQFACIHIQLQSYVQSLVSFTMGIVEKYSGKRDSVVNFGSGTGITSFLLSKNFERVTT